VKRNRMFELGFTQLGIIGALVVAVGLYIMAEHNKFVGLWISFIGFIIVAGGAFVQIHKVIAESDRARDISKPDQSIVERDRAYVHVFDGEIIHPAGSAPTVSVLIKNSGQTSARDLTWTARFILAAPDAPESEFTFSKFDTSPAILGPGDIMSYKYTFDMWKPEFDVLIEQRKAVFFSFGQIRYKDVFGNPRFNDYRLIGGGRYDIGKGIVPGKWGVADNGNSGN
jgi:hypothetical protein